MDLYACLIKIKLALQVDDTMSKQNKKVRKFNKKKSFSKT